MGPLPVCGLQQELRNQKEKSLRRREKVTNALLMGLTARPSAGGGYTDAWLRRRGQSPKAMPECITDTTILYKPYVARCAGSCFLAFNLARAANARSRTRPISASVNTPLTPEMAAKRIPCLSPSW